MREKSFSSVICTVFDGEGSPVGSGVGRVSGPPVGDGDRFKMNVVLRGLERVFRPFVVVGTQMSRLVPRRIRTLRGLGSVVLRDVIPYLGSNIGGCVAVRFEESVL